MPKAIDLIIVITTAYIVLAVYQKYSDLGLTYISPPLITNL